MCSMGYILSCMALVPYATIEKGKAVSASDFNNNEQYQTYLKFKNMYG